MLLLCLSVGTRSDNGKIVVRLMCLSSPLRDVLVGTFDQIKSLNSLSQIQRHLCNSVISLTVFLVVSMTQCLNKGTA